MLAKTLSHVFVILALLVGSLPAEVQKATKVYRIGYLRDGSGIGRNEEVFRQGLRELGYIEGQNIAIEWRFTKGKDDRAFELAAELVRLKADCIVTGGTLATRAAKEATSTIPIVMVRVGNAVQRGLVASLARPGGNVTGLTTTSPHLAGKRLDLIKETLPKLSRVGLIWNPNRQGTVTHLRQSEVAARPLGVKIQSLEVRGFTDVEKAFQTAGKEGAEALIAAGAGLRKYRAQIVGLQMKTRLPVMYPGKSWVVAGGLMSYQADIFSQFRRTAIYVDKILKGSKPSDLPVERPRKFTLIINLKTAKQLGMTIPSSLLYRADEVIK